MKNIFVLLLLIAFQAFPQKSTVVLGNEEYPYSIYAESDPPKPICILKDGRTVATEKNKKENYVAYYIFDSNHKLQKTIKLEFIHFPNAVKEIIRFIVCEDKMVVLLENEKDPETAVLYRYIADLNTGKMLSEEKLEEYNIKDQIHTFIDKNNGSYAILRSTKAPGQKTSKFSHYNSKNQLLYQTTYNHNKNEQYVEGVLLGDKCAIMTFYEIAIDAPHISLVKFDSKAQKQIEKQVQYPETYTPNYSEMHVSPQQDKLLITYYLRMGAKRNVVSHTKTISFDIIEQPVSVDDFELGKLFMVPNSKVNDYVANKLQIKENTGDGIPTEGAIDYTGNAIILKSQDPAIDISIYGVRSHEPDILGVSVFDMTGKEVGGYAIRQKYSYNGVKIFCTKKWNYIIAHDRVENYEKLETEKQKGFSANGKTMMIVYFLDNGQVKKMTPKTDDLGDEYKSFNFYEFDYELNTNQIVGIVYDNKNKHYRFGWITLE